MMSFEEFESQFSPVINHLRENACMDGIMFDQSEKELDFIFAHPPCQIWTVVDCEEETDEDIADEDRCDFPTNSWLVCSGIHYVNRLGYIVTKEALPEGESLEVVYE